MRRGLFGFGCLAWSPVRRGFPGEIVDALAGALREALTNVVKHADVEHAVVWAEVRAGVVTLSVLDQLGGVRHGGAAGTGWGSRGRSSNAWRLLAGPRVSRRRRVRGPCFCTDSAAGLRCALVRAAGCDGAAGGLHGRQAIRASRCESPGRTGVIRSTGVGTTCTRVDQDADRPAMGAVRDERRARWNRPGRRRIGRAGCWVLGAGCWLLSAGWWACIDGARWAGGGRVMTGRAGWWVRTWWWAGRSDDYTE